MNNTMSEQLPLSIHPSAELCDKFLKIGSVSNRLEAQLNFRTLSANWYCDESNILVINLYLETPEGFSFQKQQKHQGVLEDVADDVRCFYDKGAHKVNCFVAITEGEMTLLQQEEKLIASYLQIKLTKILNAIAVTKMLLPI